MKMGMDRGSPSRLPKLARAAGPLAVLLAVGCGGGGEGTGSGAGAGSGSTTGHGTGGGASSTTSGGPGGGGSGGSSSGSGGGGSDGWGPNDPGGTTVAPFGYFKAFRSGCGEELWIRFIPTADFGLIQVNASDSGGGSLSVQYFEVPEFLPGYKSEWLIDGDHGGWGPGTGSFSLTVAYPNKTTLTSMIDAPLDDLLEWPNLIEYVSARIDPVNGLVVTINPGISGNIVTMRIYDGTTKCRVATNILQTPYPISAGNMTEIVTHAGGLTSGNTYILGLQGVNAASQYVYYATLEFPAP